MRERCKEIFDIIINNCGSVAREYMQYGLDQFIDEDDIKNIPVVNSIYATIKVPAALKDAFEMKKILHLCYFMKEIPKFERAKFVNKAVYEDKDFGEKLLLTISKIEDLDKIDMLVKIFRAYGHRDGIDYNTFRRLCLCLEKAYIEDLHYLQECIDSGKEYFSGEKMFNLVNVGLAAMTILGSDNLLEDEIFQILPLGQTFYECVFTDKYKLIV